MANPDSCVTIHMVASLDGLIARKDGRVDWLETADEYPAGETLGPEFFVQSFLKTIDCYVMGSKTYETALGFEAGAWAGRTVTNPPLSSAAAIYRGRGSRSSSTRAISHSL
jgi:dihydrofolate reductase